MRKETLYHIDSPLQISRLLGDLDYLSIDVIGYRHPVCRISNLSRSTLKSTHIIDRHQPCHARTFCHEAETPCHSNIYMSWKKDLAYAKVPSAKRVQEFENSIVLFAICISLVLKYPSNSGVFLTYFSSMLRSSRASFLSVPSPSQGLTALTRLSQLKMSA